MRPKELQKLPTLDDCVHCGLCLQACPTFAITGRESESPRGRIAALRRVSEGEELTPALEEGLADCLVCRSCESACPAGISMESLMAGYRRERGTTGVLARIESFLLDEVFAHPQRVGMLTGLLRGVGPLLAAAGLELPGPERLKSATHATSRPGTRGRVAVISGCVNTAWFQQELQASVDLLSAAGWAVEVPELRCCGALHHHSGGKGEELGQETLARLEQAGADHFVCDTAGCAAHLFALGLPVIDTPGLLAREGGFLPGRKLPGRWRLAPPCHHRHGPLPEDGLSAVLSQVLEEPVQELPAPDHCCGAAGTYLLRRPGLSREVGRAARDRLRDTGATGLITGNSGCLLRWSWLAKDMELEVVHPVVLLARALDDSDE